MRSNAKKNSIGKKKEKIQSVHFLRKMLTRVSSSGGGGGGGGGELLPQNTQLPKRKKEKVKERERERQRRIES